jgi:hypothetical protein
MAERRCFGMKIVDSDAFLDMPLSTQALYFHLGMRADNDGFVNNPRRIARLIGACDDDLNILLSKRFILVFDNGVVVIKHWRIQNTLKNDRLKMPQYPEIAAKVYIKANGSYTDDFSEGVSLLDFKAKKIEIQNGIQTESNWNPNGTLIEGNGIEMKRIELNVEEEGTDSNEESDLSTDSSSKHLEFSKGTLGEGIVFMSDEQFESLCEKLTLDEIDHYFERLKAFIRKKPEATIYSHYKTILKWVEEDRSV